MYFPHSFSLTASQTYHTLLPYNSSYPLNSSSVWCEPPNIPLHSRRMSGQMKKHGWAQLARTHEITQSNWNECEAYSLEHSTIHLHIWSWFVGYSTACPVMAGFLPVYYSATLHCGRVHVFSALHSYFVVTFWYCLHCCKMIKFPTNADKMSALN